MFAHIEGIVSDKSKDTMVVDVHGIGFELNVSANTLSNTPRIGESCKLRVPGIGKKTAQRLVLELKDKIDDADLTDPGYAKVRDPQQGSAQGDAVAALLALGYTSAEAARAVSAVNGQAQDADQIIYLALRFLGGA